MKVTQSYTEKTQRFTESKTKLGILNNFSSLYELYELYELINSPENESYTELHREDTEVHREQNKIRNPQ
jgi:hypothetical protein